MRKSTSRTARRSRAWLVAPALMSVAFAGLSSPGLASAAPGDPTCQGEPATIVGAPGQEAIVGTDGPDVIVSNGVPRIDAGSGDDRVCLTDPLDGPMPATKVVGGEGDDDVVVESDVTSDPTSDARALVTFDASEGSDTYVGSRGFDWVNDPDLADRIDLREGRGLVLFRLARAPEERFSGTLDMGGEPVRVVLGVPVAPGAALISGDRSRLTTTLVRQDVDIDNARQEMTIDGVSTRIEGFTKFLVGRLMVPTFRGSDAAEFLRVKAGRSGPVHMGAGDDELKFVACSSRCRGDAIGTLRGGPGSDLLSVVTRGSASIDLARRTMSLGA